MASGVLRTTDLKVLLGNSETFLPSEFGSKVYRPGPVSGTVGKAAPATPASCTVSSTHLVPGVRSQPPVGETQMEFLASA